MTHTLGLAAALVQLSIIPEGVTTTVAVRSGRPVTLELQAAEPTLALAAGRPVQVRLAIEQGA